MLNDISLLIYHQTLSDTFCGRQKTCNECYECHKCYGQNRWVDQFELHKLKSEIFFSLFRMLLGTWIFKFLILTLWIESLSFYSCWMYFICLFFLLQTLSFLRCIPFIPFIFFLCMVTCLSFWRVYLLWVGRSLPKWPLVTYANSTLPLGIYIYFFFAEKR